MVVPFIALLRVELVERFDQASYSLLIAVDEAACFA